jgi:putative cardiolipin synthase
MQQADSEISAIYFLLRNDEVTLTALAMLRDASRRGVTTRLIVDAHFHRIPKAVLAHLRDEGVEVKVYHPLTVRHPSWLFRRMHEKLVVADRQRYITGGRNLARSYFGLAEKNYIDRDVWIDGGSATTAAEHFDELWSSDHVATLRVRVSNEEKEYAGEALDALLVALRSGTRFVNLDTGKDWSAGGHAAGRVEFLHDPLIGAAGDRVGSRLIELMEKATSSIVIESPYVIPPSSALELLERKARDGVRVTIVTNSLRSTDGVLPFAAYLRYRGRLARAGVELREYKGPDVLHGKSIVIDGRIALVGSYNLDPRSHFLNAEAMCLIEDAEIARRLEDSIGLNGKHAWKIDVHGRVDQEAAATSRTRTFGLRAARLIVPFVEGQL